MSSEERTIWELEKQSLYQQLDDKDEDINNQCQLVEQLKVRAHFRAAQSALA